MRKLSKRLRRAGRSYADRQADVMRRVELAGELRRNGYRGHHFNPEALDTLLCYADNYDTLVKLLELSWVELQQDIAHENRN